MSAWGLNEWGDIANIVIAVASVATAIVTAVVLFKQYHLQQEQLNAQQLEHQPEFTFSDSTKSLTISNTGDSMSTPAQIALHPLIFIEIERFIPNSEESSSYLYCVEYKKFNSYICTDNFKGEILACFKTPTNNGRTLTSKLDTLKKAISKKVADDENLLKCKVETFDLTKIKYKDRYKISRTLYYIGNNEISEECYNDIFKVIKNANSPININDLDNIEILEDVTCFERVMHIR